MEDYGPVKAEQHRQAALDIERLIADAGDPVIKPYIARGLFELYWGAAFHWIAVGCQATHSKHKEQHQNLARYLRDMGELQLAGYWETLESKRQGGWYGHHVALGDLEKARELWENIRTWATT